MLFILGCSTPAGNADRYADAQNYSKLTVPGQGFTHVVYLNDKGRSKRWHIYIEGDGQPWLEKRFIARDPTSKQSLMLKLMSQDTVSNLFLGRPCYYGMKMEANCEPWLWTHGRYSERVVASMVSALNKLIDSLEIKQITLIGHSGGGTLAVLIAERLKEVDTVIALAGNMDVSAWTNKHGYTPLKGSLSPAERTSLLRPVREYHFIGDKDEIIPLSAMRQYVNHRPSACLNIIPDCTHLDCWQRYWTPIRTSVSNGQSCSDIKPAIDKD